MFLSHALPLTLSRCLIALLLYCFFDDEKLISMLQKQIVAVACGKCEIAKDSVFDYIVVSDGAYGIQHTQKKH